MLDVVLDADNSIVVLKPKSELSESDFESARKIIDSFILKNKALKAIIIHTKDFPGWDSFSAFVKHLHFVQEYQKKVSYVALVTDSIVGEIAEDILDYFVNAKVEHFDYDEFDKAKQWIKEKS